MKNIQPMLFPLSLSYMGKKLQIKGIKSAYAGKDALYKIALPSMLNTVPLFWVVRDGDSWKPGFETAMDPGLQRQLIEAIAGYDEAKPIYGGYDEFELKSA